MLKPQGNGAKKGRGTKYIDEIWRNWNGNRRQGKNPRGKAGGEYSMRWIERVKNKGNVQ